MFSSGTVLTTSRALDRWDKVNSWHGVAPLNCQQLQSTFTGLLATTDFLYEINPKYATYNVPRFIKIFIDEMAKVYISNLHI